MSTLHDIEKRVIELERLMVNMRIDFTRHMSYDHNLPVTSYAMLVRHWPASSDAFQYEAPLRTR